MQIDATNTQALLQHLLRTTATTADPQQYLPPIMQAAQAILGAAGAYGVLYTEPPTVVQTGDYTDQAPQPDQLAALVGSLPSGIHHNRVTTDGHGLFNTDHVIAPIRIGGHDRSVGALFFMSPAALDHLSHEDTTALESLLDLCSTAATKTLADERAERAEKLTRSILSGITDPLFVLDQDRRVLHLNPASERAFQIEALQAQGRPLPDVVRSEELMHLAVGKNKGMTEWVAPDGRTFVPRTEPIHEPDGQIKGWILTLRDVTHFKKLVRNQTEFTRIVSHDLR
ncbi:MAG: PAS domain-containing protein, partial [Anaerolineae bacterium]|nr:PAS domain-containing protein [Anaerolineae bacterium]